MLLILTHENADFDAIASLAAAKRLYPEATALLPRQLNHNVEQFLLLYGGAFGLQRPESWRRRRVERLLLVDTQVVGSVKGMGKRPFISLIDHHTQQTPPADWAVQLEAVGATATLLTEHLQKGGLALSAEEATLFLLGIYEDTGTLTYDTTTARDAAAAAWLLEQGAQLAIVRQFLQMPLTPLQRQLYEALLAAAEWHTVHEQPIVVTTAVLPSGFTDEISGVVHRLREALQPAGLLALVSLGRDVQFVGRSTTDAVDVSQVAQVLGGGGHKRAAAAIVVRETLTAVRQKLLTLLPHIVNPPARVAQMMSLGVQTIAADTPVREAADFINRFGHEGYPVVAEGSAPPQLVGLLTRRAVDRALNHHLGHLPVRRIMEAGVVTVRPSDSVERLQQLMLTTGWGQIPVVNETATEPVHSTDLLGIVTRTDLLNFIFQRDGKLAQATLRQLLDQSLGAALWRMVQVVGQVAATMATPLYIVGGPVRDLLLGQRPTDVDMVVETDAIALARRLQASFGGEIYAHDRFGTAKWQMSTAVWQKLAPHTTLDRVPSSIDFVTARTEFYAEPSALPEVSYASIKLDLHRRDFTINTLAVRLDGDYLGQLLDFYGGRRDLEAGVIRVLHSLSFVDDPTRILRAVRFEQRLGFAIEPRTADLLQESLEMLERVSGDRIRHEIELSLREGDPAQVLGRLEALGVLLSLQVGLHWVGETAVSFARVPGLLADPAWLAALGGDSPVFVYFALWLLPLPEGTRTATMQRLRVRKRTRDDMAAVVVLRDLLATLSPDLPPSVVERRLRPFAPRVLLVVRAMLEPTDERVGLLDRYYHGWRLVKTAVDGHYLRQLGLKPGPIYAQILDLLLAARLDGLISDKAGEQALLTQWLDQRGLAQNSDKLPKLSGIGQSPSAK